MEATEIMAEAMMTDPVAGTGWDSIMQDPQEEAPAVEEWV
jgi:hypothetical protein